VYSFNDRDLPVRSIFVASPLSLQQPKEAPWWRFWCFLTLIGQDGTLTLTSSCSTSLTAVPKDDLALMEHPMFSLATKTMLGSAPAECGILR